MTKNQIVRVCNEVREFCGLQNWDIQYKFVSSKEIAKDVMQFYGEVLATASSTPAYKTAIILFNAEMLDRVSLFTIIHEFVHVLHSPFREYVGVHCNVNDGWEMFSFLEEQFVTDIETLIIKAGVNKKFKQLIK